MTDMAQARLGLDKGGGEAGGIIMHNYTHKLRTINIT